MKKVLVTAVGGDIGYGIVKSVLAEKEDYYVVGCDTKEYNISYDLVNEFYICPPYKDVDAWTEFIINLIETNGVDYFLPVTEPEIRIVRDNNGFDSIANVIINKKETLNIALDKGETAKFLGNNGVLVPKTWENLPQDNYSFPLVVKEKHSCGSHSVEIVRDSNELINSFKSMENPIVQEYVGDSDSEYSMTVFSDGNVTNHIAFKRELGFGGMSRYVELVVDSKLDNIAQKIAEIFNLRGSINIQLRKASGNYYVFEINPRISSTIGFRRLLGFNDVIWWIDMLEGRNLEKYRAPKATIFGVRSVEEKLYFVEEENKKIIRNKLNDNLTIHNMGGVTSSNRILFCHLQKMEMAA